MSGRGRLALCATAASLMAAGALLPLVDKDAWILTAALLVAVQAGVGALARRVPLARTLTVAVQAVVALMMLTLVFARDAAVGGVLPGPEAVQEFTRLLTTGADEVGRYAIPAPATEGIRLMLVGGVLLIALAVDAIAVTFRSAAPAGLPLLALYSVAAGLSPGGASWMWFLLAASGYLLLLLAEGRDRLSQWGRVFSGAPRAGGRTAAGGYESAGGSALAPVRTGRRIGVVALGVALAVPAALPALDGGLLSTAGSASGGGSGGGTISAVNPLVSLQNSLNQPEDREVLRYRTNTDSTKDLYLRIVALDQFDGAAWKSSERRIEDVPDRLPRPQGLAAGVRVTEINSSVSAAGWYAQSYLPLPYPATRVDIGGRWRYEPAGRTVVGDRGQTTRGVRYTAGSLVVRPTAGQLASATPPPAGLLRDFTKVPGSLPEVVEATALRITKDASNDYERAVALQDWFASEGGFRYDTEVRSGSGTAAITRFLRDKEGFCVHFSFTMAAMARTLGIPARVAVGFTPGTAQGDGTMSVGLRDAHAWPELYFEGVGWTRFEPTPTRGSVPDYTRDQTPSETASEAAQARPSTSSAPSAAPSVTDSCPPQMRRQGECGAAVQQGGGGSTTPWWVLFGGLLWVTAVVFGVLVLALVLSLPLLWRIHVRSQRLGSKGRTPVDAAARTLAGWREITDAAWDHGIAPDESQTPRKAAARIVRLGKLEGASAEAVHRAAGAVEQVLYSPRPPVVGSLTEEARLVRAGLRAAAGRGARLRAVLVPRSAVRVVWALSARWAAVTNRWEAGRRGLEQWAGGLRRRPSRQRG
ncbi:transglutaminase TgpA family protein [Streptomyces sp. NPDC054887]